MRERVRGEGEGERERESLCVTKNVYFSIHRHIHSTRVCHNLYMWFLCLCVCM